LSFVYQIQLSNTSGEDIGRFNTFGYAGWTTTVGDNDAKLPGITASTLVAPSSVQRSSVGLNLGNQISWNFGTVVDPGQASYELIINTTATKAQATGTVNSIDDVLFSGSNFWVPAGTPDFTTPAPSSLALCAAGLVTLGGWGALRRLRREKLTLVS
jgi:hypothetical protein